MPDAPFDPDAFIQQNKIKPLKGQGGQFDPDAFLKAHGPPGPHDYTEDVVNVARGFGKGLARPIVGAGQIAEDVVPGTRETINQIPGARTAAHAAKEFATSEDPTWGEWAGDVGGEITPWVVGAFTGADEAAGGAYLMSKAAPYLPKGAYYVNRAGQAAPYLRTKAAEWLTNMAARAGFGATAGGLQATKEGDLKSHGENVLIGAGAGVVGTPKIAGPLTGTALATGGGWGIEQLVREVGWGPVLGALSSLGVGSGYAAHHYGLPTIARKIARQAGKGSEAIFGRIPSGATGSEAVQEWDRYFNPGDGDGR